MRRTILGFWPTGKTAAANEGMWVIEQLTCAATASTTTSATLSITCGSVSEVSIAA